MELIGKRALVMGGASGIGKASSLALAQAGADVVLTYWSSADEAQEVVAQIRALGRKAQAIKADLTDDKIAERTPARREGAPEDVANVVVFLASERAAFLAGEIIQVNGGLGLY